MCSVKENSNKEWQLIWQGNALTAAADPAARQGSSKATAAEADQWSGRAVPWQQSGSSKVTDHTGSTAAAEQQQQTTWSRRVVQWQEEANHTGSCSSSGVCGPA